jgi:pyruvate/2-oxoglutarate dehydrogenase complex dihydrolipoamide dehydrogenase (E3) component
MSAAEPYEIVIIGSGESGKHLARTMGKKGRRTVVIERRYIGGSCPNIACLPSKNVVHSAKVASLYDRGCEFGLPRDGPIDAHAVFMRKRLMVEGEIALHLQKYEDSGVELVMGEAHFTEAKTIEVRLNVGGVRYIRGDKIFLNLGTRAAIPHVPGLLEASPLTHVEALDLDRIPEHLIILGGGFVSLEMGQMFRRLGSEVTIIHRGQQLASREDPDTAEALLTLFRDEGITVCLESTLQKVEGRSGEGVTAEVVQGGKQQTTIRGSDLLVAVGRTPNTQGIGLGVAGVDLDPRDYIKVNERLRTTAKDIWAMGDCAGSPHFTHVAFDDFRVVLSDLTGGQRTTTNRLVPFCIFTDPELAQIGLTEREATARGLNFQVVKIPAPAILRYHTLGELRGFAKALIDPATKLILGFTGFIAEASEMMAVMQSAILTRTPYPVLRDGIWAHPTTAEGIGALFATLP